MKLKIENWDIDFFKYGGTYSHLLMGEPTKKGNEGLVDYHVTLLKESFYLTEEEVKSINVLYDYSGYFGGTNDYDKNEFALKPVICVFRIANDTKASYVITFTDEDETPEELVERVVKNYELKFIDWEY
jgi:hypothetical protein